MNYYIVSQENYTIGTNKKNFRRKYTKSGECRATGGIKCYTLENLDFYAGRYLYVLSIPKDAQKRNLAPWDKASLCVDKIEVLEKRELLTKDTFEYLLESGAKASRLAYLAIRHQNLELFRFVFERDENLNAEIFFETALLDSPKIAEFLLEKIELSQERKNSLFLEACLNCDTKVARALFRAGANNAEQALESAILYNNTIAIVFLVGDCKAQIKKIKFSDSARRRAARAIAFARSLKRQTIEKQREDYDFERVFGFWK